MAEDREELHVASKALKEIEDGNAYTCVGFKVALYGRAVVEYCFALLAKLYTSHVLVAASLLALVIIVYGAFCVGIVYADVEEEVNGLIVKVEDQKDLDYTDRFLGGDFASLEVVIQQISGPGCPGLYSGYVEDHVATLQDHLTLLRSVIQMNVTFQNRVYTFRDLCIYVPFETPMPDFDRVMNGLHTCAMFTTLDCFWEGSILQNPLDTVIVEKPSYCDNLPDTLTWSNFDYDEFIACLRAHPNESMVNEQVIAGLAGLRIQGYLRKNCFSNDPRCPNPPTAPTNLNEVFQDVSSFQNLNENVGGCVSYAGASVTPLQLIRGVQQCSDDSTLVRAIKSSLILNGPDSLQTNLKKVYNVDLNLSDTLGLLNHWKNKFFAHSVQFNERKADQRKVSNDLIVGQASNINQKLANQLSALIPSLLIIGYILMILYCAFAFFKMSFVHSRMSVGLVGVFVVILATTGTLGITSFAGHKLTLLTTQIYPFLVLGLGVDDMFVIVGTFLDIERNKGPTASIKELIKDTMVTVGPSVTLTSLTNFIGFWLVYVIPLPIFQSLVIEITIAIALNYIGLLIAIPCYLVIDHHRVHGQFVDIFCCIPANLCQRKEKDAKKEPSKFSKWVVKVHDKYHSFLTYFVCEIYSPFLQYFVVKIGVLVLFFALLGISIWGCFRVEEIATATVFSEQNSPEYYFAVINEEYFRTEQFFIVTKDIDYPNLQPQLLAMDARIANVTHVLSPTSANRLWLKVMIDYYDNLQAGACGPGNNTVALFDLLSLIAPIVAPNANVSDICNYSLLNTVPAARADPRGNVTVKIIPPERFYYYLRIWATLDAVNLAFLAAFLNPPPELYFFMGPFEPAQPLLYAQSGRYIDQLLSVANGETFLRSTLGILDDYEKDGVESYILGFVYITYSQYLNLEKQIATGAAGIILACFFVTSIFLMDIHSGLVMLTILVVNAINVLGFIGHFKIGMSYFPGMMYLAGIAVAVEFTAPLAFYFLKSTADPLGDKYADLEASGVLGFVEAIVRGEYDRRNQRMHRALQHRFEPIFNGAITTFISIMMLYFAPLQFIRQYYWGILMIIIVSGMFNGLLFLPVLLSLFGPSQQVWPTNGTNAKAIDAKNPITEDEELKEQKPTDATTTFMY